MSNKISLLIFSFILLFSSCLKESEDPNTSAKSNLKDGEEFLAKNAKEPDVIITDSGLQYKILKHTEGLIPNINSTVKCNYEGRFINGGIFDSSDKKGEPVEFPVNAVIKGWTEALMLMHKGEKWQLYIPYQLAYGYRGCPGIGPCQALIFDIELTDIKQ